MFFAVEQSLNPNPWRWQPHPEVWVLIVSLVAAYVYAVRVIGPRVAPAHMVLKRKQAWNFTIMIALLWLASDWPMHDISEEYLYSVHMVQHMVLSYLVPPLALLATPEWLIRLIIGEGAGYRFVRRLTKPVLTILVYSVVVVITHIPALVNLSASTGPVHYILHVLIVLSNILLWMPIVSPATEFQIAPLGKIVYLFCSSFVTIVPAGWLTFAEDVVYKHYDTPVRVWGVSAISDQQAAALIMKTGGTVILWTAIIGIFVRNFGKGFMSSQDKSYELENASTPTER